jgi:phosphodiesterase/alkaline phosphatase D-like protein
VGSDTVYFGGLFTLVGGVSHLRLAAVDKATGAIRPAFDQGADSTVNALALRGGTLFAGGQFSNITNPGTTRNHLAALDATTGALGAFDPDISNNVVALLAAGTHLYAGGNFATVGGVASANFARFTDPVVAPVAVTGAASPVTSTSATLAGTINPGGAPVSYTFEYGPSTSFGSNSGFASAGSGTSDVPVAATLSGLTPDTTYYYRAVAKDGSGVSYFGSVSTFDTGPGGAPIVVTGAASAVTNTGATLSGTVDPHGRQTAFTFEYGTSFATSGTTLISAVDNEDAGNGPRTVSLPIGGLAPDTTYFYRLVASNASGTAMGAVTTFMTGPGGAPLVTTGAASAITASGTTLAGTVDAHGAQTAYTFEYGTTTAFGSITTVAGAGSSNGVESVSLPVSGLTAGTTYLYRLVATNASGTTTGAVHFFTTSSFSKRSR